MPNVATRGNNTLRLTYSPWEIACEPQVGPRTRWGLPWSTRSLHRAARQRGPCLGVDPGSPPLGLVLGHAWRAATPLLN